MSAPQPDIDFDKNNQTAWEPMWSRGVNPGEYFDREKPLPELINQVRTLKIPKGKRAMIPGCGRGYDIELLSRSGLFEQVIGIDISQTAVASANTYLSNVDPPLPNNYKVMIADFFNADLGEQVDFLYDFTFFCAIPLELRGKWGERMKTLIKSGGSLVTIMFPYGARTGGPPFAVKKEDYESCLGEEFVQVDGPRLLDDDTVHAGTGSTWWCRWERI